MPRFEVKGKHYETGKKQTRIYEANDEFQAVEYGLADGLIVETSTLLKDEPKTDPKLLSAKDKKYNERIDKNATIIEKNEKGDVKKKKCRYCAMMIPEAAKICPYCTKTLGGTLPAKIFVGLIVLGVLGSFVGKIVRETLQKQPVAPRTVSRPVQQPKAPRRVETSYSSRRGGGTETISAGEYGKEWPFTVSSGRLACSGAGAVTFTAKGKTYAVNGLAMSDHRNSNIREIWKDDSESEHAKYMLKQGRPDLVPKVSISPIINRGLKLCK
jgi:hypothetical protein